MLQLLRGQPAMPDGSERAHILFEADFFPNVVHARAQQPIVLTFHRPSTAGPDSGVVLPDLGRLMLLPPDTDVVVELGRLAPGEYAFHGLDESPCGTLIVTLPRDGRRALRRAAAIDM